MNEVHKIYKMY